MIEIGSMGENDYFTLVQATDYVQKSDQVDAEELIKALAEDIAEKAFKDIDCTYKKEMAFIWADFQNIIGLLRKKGQHQPVNDESSDSDSDEETFPPQSSRNLFSKRSRAIKKNKKNRKKKPSHHKQEYEYVPK